MFLESTINKQTSFGSVEVICGSMFSGKTEELIRRLKRAEIAKQSILVFKPQIDVRYDKNSVVSHDKNSLSSTVVSSSKEVLIQSEKAQVIAIDEVQFFDDDLPTVCSELAKKGKRIIVAGLDMDYTGKPFGPVPELLAIADFVTKLRAICSCCGNPALYSNRKTTDKNIVQLGEKEEYEPLCRACFNTSL